MTAEQHLWSGRFSARPDPEMMRLTASSGVDIELLGWDVAATKAHARSLVAAGLLDEEHLAGIDSACDDLVDLWKNGSLDIVGAEDVHSIVEKTLTDRLGDVGARIHAGRSRNDLVATDLRLWCKARSLAAAATVSNLALAICDVAEQHIETLMPGYTHLQRAQPVSLGFHLAAHGFALLRDIRRFEGAHDSADVCVLGAGALAGTTLPIDPRVATKELGFTEIFDNAMDAVADRDFACDLVYAAALCGVHLSRLAEEIVLWTGSEFGFARLADEWSTGSSMMPQKRNPDLAELIRGRAARGIGDLTSLLGLLKGLPLAYDRDLQEDKELVFASVERVIDAAFGMRSLVLGLTFDVERMSTAAASSATWATDLAEVLVARGVPFRVAHEATGALVRDLEERELDLARASVEDLVAHHPSFEASDVALADPRVGMAARTSHGGTAPERVREQLASLRRSLAESGHS